MASIIWFAICMAAIVLLILGVGLYMKGNSRQEQDVVYSRLAAQEGDGPDLRPLATDSHNPVVRAISRRLLLAGFEPTESHIVVGALALAMLVAVLLASFGFMLGALVTVSLLLVIHLFLLQRSARRQRTLAQQLPDFMDRLLRPVIAGNTLEESFVIATRESPEPVRGLFLSVARQVRLGAALEDVLARIATLHDLSDLHALAMAVRVNRRYGGNLRQMVKSLMYMARTREAAAQELRALTAETRFSAWVLVAIPVSITAFILMRNPDYYRSMWDIPVGRGILIAGFVLQFIGIFVIWQMMRSTAEARG